MPHEIIRAARLPGRDALEAISTPRRAREDLRLGREDLRQGCRL